MEKPSFFSFRKGDILAIVLVFLLAAAVALAFLPGKESSATGTVQIFQNGILLRELPLNTDAQFEISGDYTNSVRIQDGKASIETSDCPGSDCVRSGWISQPGRSIVCLPNRLEVRICGETDVDLVLR